MHVDLFALNRADQGRLSSFSHERFGLQLYRVKNKFKYLFIHLFMSLFIICDFDFRLQHLFLIFNTCEKFSALFFFDILNSYRALYDTLYLPSTPSICICQYVFKYVCLWRKCKQTPCPCAAVWTVWNRGRMWRVRRFEFCELTFVFLTVLIRGSSSSSSAYSSSSSSSLSASVTRYDTL